MKFSWRGAQLDTLKTTWGLDIVQYDNNTLYLPLLHHPYGPGFIGQWSAATDFVEIHVTAFIIPPAQRSCWGYIGFTPSVRPSRISCPLCSAYNWIHFIFIHLIKQLQKVCGVKSFLQNFWQFFKICNFDFVLFWLGIWCKSLVWVIMGRRRVSQNAGVLVVLVHHIVYPTQSLIDWVRRHFVSIKASQLLYEYITKVKDVNE